MTEQTLAHVRDRHGDEPLELLFGPELADDFRRHAPARRDVLTRCSQILEQAIHSTLAEGPVLAYDVRARRKTGVWLAVLVCGAVVVLRHHPRHSRLATLFFPGAGLGRRSAPGRYSAVVHRYVQRYAPLDHHRNAVVPPPPDHTIRVRGEVRTNIRFAHCERWGFCPELAGCPYRGRPTLPEVTAAGLGLRSRFRRG